VGVAIVPESAARRNVKSMRLAQIELTDAWRVRERYILVRELEELPAFARSLIDELCDHFRRGKTP
jgi:DNA-binding transcriptional LysR family regulator